NTDNWFYQYDEMRNMAYDTIPILHSDTIFNRATSLIQNDTIPIGFLDSRFNYLKPDALTTNTYFNFDTINNLLSDVTGAPSPYLENRIFTVSPLTNSSAFLTVIFRFDPQFYFNDATSISEFTNGAILKVDFGDGNGYQTINYFGGVQSFTINYPSAGTYYIKSMVYITGRTRTSFAEFLVGGNTITSNIKITNVDGIKVNVYPNGCNPNPYNKVVIYLEGIDPLEQRNADQIYSEMIQSEEVAQLRNHGYTFVVVNWKNSMDDISDNAHRVVELLNYLKCQADDPLPYVLIGESMGGLVGKYALLYMESNQYQNDPAPDCAKLRLMHNTRLFISLDVPHQGANIPIGVQHFYRDATNLFCLNNMLGKARLASHNLFLDSKAAKQMLIYHESTRNSKGEYTSHTFRDQLLDDFTNMGSYPRFCKNVTMVNGSMGGVRQANIFNNPRPDNDLMLNITGKIELTILGKKLKVFENAIRIYTNPNGNGNVYNSTAGTLNYKIKLKWFGVKIVSTYTNLHNNIKDVKNVLPYCTNAASIFATGVEMRGNLPNKIAFFLAQSFGLISVSPGNYQFSHSVGIPWVGTTGFGIDATSNGFSFGFIPTKSAMDFTSNSTILNENLIPFSNSALDYLLDNQAFDLIIGNDTSDNTNFTIFNNRDHLHMRNDQIDTFLICNNPILGSHIVNREIGDDTIRIDNAILNRNATYESETNTRVNTFDHFMYSYQGALNVPLSRIYSRHNPFQYEVPNPGSYSAKFRSGGSNIISFMNGTFQHQIVPMANCCIDYGLRQPIPTPEPTLQTSSYLQVYPNPASNRISLSYYFTTKGDIQIRITDITGKSIYKTNVPNAQNNISNTTPIDLFQFHLTPSIYLIEVSNGTERLFSKFVKH
ncbi:MAG: T9SS type A sorting domain-containing protein, partial [Chitinophagaceae bacterium]|nr:T9SS type A sorting domain-containing protein [Chitinophagaceae bacterium]